MTTRGLNFKILKPDMILNPNIVVTETRVHLKVESGIHRTVYIRRLAQSIYKSAELKRML
jgi:hypothetical protein